MGRLIYADNAATTQLDKDALEAMLPWLEGGWANASQPYSLARGPKKAIREAREAIAACIGAKPQEIYFTSGGTESDNWAIKGILRAGSGDRLVTSAVEHPAVMRTAEAVRELGHPLRILAVDSECLVSAGCLNDALAEEARLVSVMLVNNETGAIEPVRELAAAAHAKGALFHTDAVQALGHIPVDVRNLGVDMLSASAHKFHGPRGAGFLYVREGTPLLAYAHGGGQEGGLRAGTENTAGAVGMATALTKSCRDLESTASMLAALERELIACLDAMGLDYLVNGPKRRSPGLLSLSLRGLRGEALLHRLDLMGICVSTGSACSAGRQQVSHVIRAMGVPSEYAVGTIRVSLGRDNTAQDVHDIAAAIGSVVGTAGCGFRHPARKGSAGPISN